MPPVWHAGHLLLLIGDILLVRPDQLFIHDVLHLKVLGVWSSHHRFPDDFSGGSNPQKQTLMHYGSHP